jgi:DNA-binding IclR family transcriptional regulator
MKDVNMAGGEDSAAPDGGKPIRTLLRGLAVLEALAEIKGRAGPTELAERVGLDKSTVSRFLQTLKVAGYVHQDPDRRTYHLSAKVLSISHSFNEHLDLRRVARPHLERLRDEVQETVHLGVRSEDRIVYVDKVEPERSVRLVSAVGRSVPIHTTALGKAILSRYSEEEMDAIVRTLELEQRTSRSITSHDRLREAIRETAARGYAIDDGENEDHVSCVAAPVVGSGDEVLGALSVSSPTFRIAEQLDEVGMLCRVAADDISREAGHRAPV